MELRGIMVRPCGKWGGSCTSFLGDEKCRLRCVERLHLALWERATVRAGVSTLLHVFCPLNCTQIVLDLSGSS